MGNAIDGDTIMSLETESAGNDGDVTNCLMKLNCLMKMKTIQKNYDKHMEDTYEEQITIDDIYRRHKHCHRNE